jgi:hypothetical protein
VPCAPCPTSSAPPSVSQSARHAVPWALGPWALGHTRMTRENGIRRDYYVGRVLCAVIFRFLSRNLPNQIAPSHGTGMPSLRRSAAFASLDTTCDAVPLVLCVACYTCENQGSLLGCGERAASVVRGRGGGAGRGGGRVGPWEGMVCRAERSGHVSGSGSVRRWMLHSCLRMAQARSGGPCCSGSANDRLLRERTDSRHRSQQKPALPLEASNLPSRAGR